MNSHIKIWAVATVVLCQLVAPSTIARGADNIRQYRAAMTQIFLWNYAAMPVYGLNPVFPGDVILLKSETRYLSHAKCYNNMKGGNYRRISDYSDGMKISASVDIKVKGELLHKEIAEVNAGAKGTIRDTATLTVSPLSADSVGDVRDLYHVTSDPDCRIIPAILDGKQRGFAVIDRVLFGQVNVSLQADISGSASAGAKGELIKRIAKVFSVSEADVQVSGKLVTFAVSTTPQPMPLAIVPPHFSFEELARITSFLDGKRGADLEIAVEEALAKQDYSYGSKLWARIESILGKEIKNKERWAENFVNGDKPMTVAELRKAGINFPRVGEYAAAMELVRREAPSFLPPSQLR